MYMGIYSTGQKKVNVSMVRYAPGALEVCSWYSLGTLEFSVWRGAVRCGAVRCGWCGAVRLLSAMCARLGFVHVADSCDVERSPC